MWKEQNGTHIITTEGWVKLNRTYPIVLGVREPGMVSRASLLEDSLVLVENSLMEPLVELISREYVFLSSLALW